ncbi:MAG: O-antigen ligase [Pseudomonadota bacterium]
MPALQTVSVEIRPGAGPLRPAKTRPSRFELALLFCVLILFSEGVLPRLVAAEETAEGSPILRLVWLPIYAMALVGLFWQARQTMSALMRQPFLVALMGLGGLSFLWSIDPALSQRRGLAIVMTIIAGVAIAVRYDWRTLLRMLGLVWLTVAVLSSLTALLNPSFGVMDAIHVGAWKGLYYEKNQLGGHMARAAFLFTFLAVMDRPWRRLWIVALGLAVLLVLATTSKTSLLGLLLGQAVIAIAWVMKRGRIFGLSTVWIGALVGGLFLGTLIFSPDVIFAVLGRDPSLTGRTDIWAVLLDKINDRPWLGYGYGAFWTLESEPAYWVREVLDWEAPTAHNGWLEVAIALGLVGLACLVLDFLMTLARAVWVSIGSWTGVFALGVCAQFILFSLSESISMQQNAMTWLTYVMVATKLAVAPKGSTPLRPLKVRRPLRSLSADGPV